MEEGAVAVDSPQLQLELDGERPSKRLRLDNGQQHAQSPSYLSVNGDLGASGYTSPAPKSGSGRGSVAGYGDSEAEGHDHHDETPRIHESDEEYRYDEAAAYHDDASQRRDASRSGSHTPFDATPKLDGDAKHPSAPASKAEVRGRYQQRLILRGHKKGVSAVKFSPDGRWIGSCSADATIKIWDATTGKHSQTFQGHLAGISTIAWSPDSKTIASGSDDKSIRLWDIVTGKPYPVPLLGHQNYVYSIAFSPKGNMLVSGSYDEAVFLWDVRSGRLMRSLPAHSDPVGGVDFVHDGTLIVSCASDGLIRVWDTATGQCLRTLVHEDNAAVVSVRFSPNGKYVLAWTLDSCVRLWNYVEGRCVKTYQGHRNEKYSVSGTFAVVPLSDPDIHQYSRRRLSHRSRGHDDDHDRNDNELSHQHRDLRHDRSGSLGPMASSVAAVVVSPSEDGSLVVWDVKSKNILQKTDAVHSGVVLSVDTHPTQPVLVSCGLDRTIRIWRNEEMVGTSTDKRGRESEGENGVEEHEEREDEENPERKGAVVVDGEETHEEEGSNEERRQHDEPHTLHDQNIAEEQPELSQAAEVHGDHQESVEDHEEDGNTPHPPPPVLSLSHPPPLETTSTISAANEQEDGMQVDHA